MEHKELIETVAKYLGHIIALICLAQIYIIYWIKRNEFLNSLRGKDLTWQLLEISGVGWYMLFPTLVIVSLLGLNVTTEVWASMDFIYTANLGFKRFDKYLEHKYPKNESPDNKENKKDETIM